jgi:maltooligosyltrehalose synthase
MGARTARAGHVDRALDARIRGTTPGVSEPLLATYRLQLGPGLGFGQVREMVPYLRELGISHLYLSPALQARAGSTHGYDVVDPTRISE